MINIVVPMAGLGSRFDSRQYDRPKPLIEIAPGRPMISYVVDFLTLSEPHHFTFVCRAVHDREYGLAAILSRLVPGSDVVLIQELTRGPAHTALHGVERVDQDQELVVAYCDAFLSIEYADVLARARRLSADGAVVTYPSDSPRDSYAVLDSAGNVLRTAEKQVISPSATAGYYYFRRGRDFVDGARAMIAAAAPDGPEIFVCPVYNELLAAGKRIVSYPISLDERFDSGTPDDLSSVQHRLAISNRRDRAIVT